MAERNAGRLRAAAVRAARSQPTPFYLFDPAAARAALRAWRRAAGAEAELFYPWKCNRYAGLLALARLEGYGAEVTAEDDLEAALGAYPGSRVVFQGPAKSRRALERALSSGAWIAADSEADAAAILERARALGVAPRYLLRLHARAADVSQHAFGMAPARALAFCEAAQRGSRPLPEGLAFHLGTGLAARAPYLAAVREAGALRAALARRGVAVRVLDVGGGFAAQGESRRGAAGRVRRAAAGPEDFLRSIRDQAARSLPGARLFLEPGRAVAADAFHLVTCVVRVAGRRVFVDASRMSHAYFVPRGRHALHAIPPRPGRSEVEVRGPLPVDLDLFGRSASLGRPREGDLVVVASVGAYNLIAGSAWAGAPPGVVEMPVSARGSAGGRRSGARPRR